MSAVPLSPDRLGQVVFFLPVELLHFENIPLI